jgi:hypothetical protein
MTVECVRAERMLTALCLLTKEGRRGPKRWVIVGWWKLKVVDCGRWIAASQRL